MTDLKSGSTEVVAGGVVHRFALPAPADSATPCGEGLINATFLVAAGGTRYILQRINDRVFPEPEKIMSNLTVLERHLATHTGFSLRIPALIASRDGLPFVRDGDGGIWRLMEYIPNTKAVERIRDLKQAREVGRILGRFHVLVGDLRPDRLAVTLPGFHVTPKYLARFAQVLQGQTETRSEETAKAITFVISRQGRSAVLEQARQEGRVPERVVHGDPKLDNILFDRDTGRAVSLIDLDTVQPGLVHYDLGDCIRSCCNRRGECTDGEAELDLALCRAILDTYANETEGLLCKAEIELLFDAIRLIPFELGLRFLTDHLEGDRYFRVTERGQNLRKARAQFALVDAIENKEQEIRRILDDCFGYGETGV